MTEKLNCEARISFYISEAGQLNVDVDFSNGPDSDNVAHLAANFCMHELTKFLDKAGVKREELK